MLSNIIYKLSIFADYTEIEYTIANIQKMLNTFTKRNFLPNLMNETDLSSGNVMQRLQMRSPDNAFTITIWSNRIDVEACSNKKNGFTQEERADIPKCMTDCMKDTLDTFQEMIPDGNRLAWIATYAYFGLSDEKKMEFRNRFIRNTSFFEENQTEEMAVHNAAKQEQNILNETEQWNVILDINRWEEINYNSEKMDGFRINFDINTNQKNKRNRYKMDSCLEFVNRAITLQKQLEEETLYGCN